MARRRTGFTSTPDIVGPDHPLYNIGQENGDEFAPKEYRYGSKFMMVVCKVLLQEAYNYMRCDP